LERKYGGRRSTIGAITFAVCLVGFEFGKRIGSSWSAGRRPRAARVLIAIGFKILVGHLLSGS
jgi:putative Mn2+ efflux pump MntP